MAVWIVGVSVGLLTKISVLIWYAILYLLDSVRKDDKLVLILVKNLPFYQVLKEWHAGKVAKKTPRILVLLRALVPVQEKFIIEKFTRIIIKETRSFSLLLALREFRFIHAI